MYRYIGETEVEFISHLTSALDGSEGLTSHPSNFSPKKEPQYQLYSRLSGPQSWSGHFKFMK
jgi:hypothetical protein